MVPHNTSLAGVDQSDSEGLTKAKTFIKKLFDLDEKKTEVIFDTGAIGDHKIDTVGEMWYQVFLWALFSSIFVHTIAAIVALCAMRNHKLGRWIPVLILLLGMIGTIIGGSITSAVIAWSYANSSERMPPLYALLAGITQTVVLLIVSFTKIMATL